LTEDLLDSQKELCSMLLVTEHHSVSVSAVLILRFILYHNGTPNVQLSQLPPIPREC